MIAWLLLSVLASEPAMTDLDFEPNDTFATAVTVHIPLVHGAGCIDTADDVDFYTFTLTDPTPIFLTAKGKGTALFRVTLWGDPQKDALRKDAEIIDIGELDPGNYFARVTGQKGCYDLQIVAETRTPPYGSATVPRP